MTDLSSGDLPAEASPDIKPSSQKMDSEIEQLLRPFLDQAWPIRSLVAVGFDRLCGQIGPDARGVAAIDEHNEAFLLRLIADGGNSPAIVARIPLQYLECRPGGGHAYTLDSLARQARELLSDAPGNDLLLAPVHALNEIMTPLSDEFRFRAVVTLASRSPGCRQDFWKVWRRLFDCGLICIGSVQVAGYQASCFLASDAVQVLPRGDAGSRGHVTMSELAHDGGFANQLFRYAYVKLYAFRHGLTAAFPEWQGSQLFGLDDESCAARSFRRLTFYGFTDQDRLLWDRDDPPIDIDLNGYFQDIPACWRRHRPFLRRLFQLPLEHQNAIDSWRRDATRDGQRTLVAIHVRRGDYRQLQLLETPWFRLVPEGWYVDWLRTVWPTLRDPLLFVATDEPDAILPLFQEFEIVSAKFDSPAQLLPNHVRDFEILRRADFLAICNSSFSRMAAILAPSSQKCFLPSFQTQCFAPYEPWIDPAFWVRFADAWWARPLSSGTHRRHALAVNNKNAFDEPEQSATIYFDVSDLLLYLESRIIVSGIQRVQCEILLHLPEIIDEQNIRFVFLNDVGDLDEIEKSSLLNTIQNIGCDARSRAEILSELRALFSHAKPCRIRPHDIFLTIGAFWAVSGIGRLLQKLKNFGVVIGVFIHDILPITAPEYFEARDTRAFVKCVVEALTFTDFILTASEYNKASLAKYKGPQRMDPLPVYVVPLARELASTMLPIEFSVSSGVASVIRRDYVLCVGTIEVRKNPTYLFNLWKLMVRSGRATIPLLVFAGRKGWLVQDFMDQVKACNYLDGRIVFLHDVTDAELDLLYRKCMLTMFPSFAEGWGLPVGESLARGKITICSAAGGIPEVGGKLLDYIDPYNVNSGLELVMRYLDDSELRRSREREIDHHFEPRSWQEVADDFLRSTQTLARQVQPSEAVAAIMLPPNRFLPISADARALLIDGMDGALSAELACVSGWQVPRVWGANAGGPVAMLRFRPPQVA